MKLRPDACEGEGTYARRGRAVHTWDASSLRLPTAVVSNKLAHRCTRGAPEQQRHSNASSYGLSALLRTRGRKTS
jgi:hypothetical protein